MPLTAKAGYPNSKKGRKMEYTDSLIQKKRETKVSIKLLIYPLLLIFKQYQKWQS